MTGFNPQTFKTNFPAFAAMQREGRPFHYLDSGASSLTCADAINAMAKHDTHLRANVHRSVHYWAEQATQAYEGARAKIAAYFGINPSETIITSGTTQALNIAAYGLSDRLTDGDEVLLAIDNHHANIVPWHIHAKPQGAIIKSIAVEPDGTINTDTLASLLSANTKIVALPHVSNVTGREHDLTAIGNLVRAIAPEAVIVVDGAQSAAHWPLYGSALPQLPIDIYACSAHKMFGPTGVGMLWGRAEILDRMPPLLGGGEMIKNVTIDDTQFADVPTRFEAGTPPITQAVGFGAAVDFLSSLDHHQIRDHEAALVVNFASGVTPFANILGGADYTNKRAPIVSFKVDGCHPHDLSQLADRTGVAMRGGHHCAQPLMAHFGILASTRASFAGYNDVDDVDAALQALTDAITLLKG